MRDNHRYPAEIAALLRSASGTWVKIREGDQHLMHSTATNYRRGVVKAYPAGRFEFEVKSLGYGTNLAALYARHIGTTFPVDAE
jgi:hypothetical protein